ncbi:MAG: hypothetical protein RLZZ126_804, partial [Pseudomonadota bacterium]
DGQPLSLRDACTPGARVHYFRDVPNEEPIPFQETVLYQDEHLLVVDKPHFLPVVPSGRHLRETLLVRLRERLKLPHLSPVHRIDRDTAGLVMFSVNPVTRNAYHALFRRRAVHKTYEALTRWNPDVPWVREGSCLSLRHSSRIVPSTTHFMQMMEASDAHGSVANAETHIRVLSVAGDLARLELQPLTGQRHQLRVHLNALGMPIEHDSIYPVLQPEGTSDFTRPLQLLARSLSFADPVSGHARAFESAFALQLK